MVIRLIKHDLRIIAGPKHILDGVHPNAYAAYQSSRDLAAVINQVISKSGDGKQTKKDGGKGTTSSVLTVGIKLMTPVLPMLAEVFSSTEQAMKKCPSGMFCDIKYDGERVQVHKQGKEFKYFSRSLKPVLPHKVNHFKDYIPQAFPSGEDLILDSEVLLIDTKSGKPLPFGTLGKHKKTTFQDATVCLFVFDCIYYNGEDLTNKPLKDRRKILESIMVEIPNHVHFSEMKEVNKADDLLRLIEKVIRLGLEGLVIKNVLGTYEPGKRHWLKVKKDYLNDGEIADTADLVVLGAWYGTGQKGGMKSVFLMGCYDPDCGKWKSVTKVHTGVDDETLERLQKELKMDKIDRNPSQIPSWLVLNKTMYPDFVSKDPLKSPVWEISGAEFTQNQVHTADGISMRFPRIKKIRHDKTADQATSLPELKVIFKMSKETADFFIPRSAGGSPVKRSSLNRYIENEAGTSKTPSTSDCTMEVEDETQYEGRVLLKELFGDESSKKVSDESPSKRIATPRGQKRRNENPDMSPTLKRWLKGPSEHEKTPFKSEEKTPVKSEEKTPVKSEDRRGPEKPLPDIFVGVRACLPRSLSKEDRFTLTRYVRAYGGKILDDYDANQATHILYDSNAKVKLNGKEGVYHVVLNWLWTSIKVQKLLDVKKFSFES